MSGSQQAKAAGTAEQMKVPSPAQQTTEVLHQRKKLPVCPMKMAVGGFAIAATLGYFVLYSKKKPEATAMDVAKVTIGVSNPENTRPRK